MLVSQLIRLCSSFAHRLSIYINGGRGTFPKRILGGFAVPVPCKWSISLSLSLIRQCHSNVGDLFLNESVQRHLQILMKEYRHLTRTLQHEFLGDLDRKCFNKRQIELSPVANVFQKLEGAIIDLHEVESLLQIAVDSGEEDQQMIQLLQEEQAHTKNIVEALKKDLITSLVPIDPHDSSNALLEVMSGRTTGGDICQQFTREMFDMYQGYASYKNWDFEVFNYTPAEYGGLHHAAVRVVGQSVYRHLKHEGGTHRVQRIPEVGLSSRMQRIHTGTMTVVVLPQPSELEVHIDPKDLRIDTFRSKGAGGQSVNTTDSAVRIVHLPTGTAVECQQSRSQLQNRDTAMGALRTRLYQSMMGKETEQRHTARKQQVGTRSQSERIRTYNFSQDRITDHRTGYVTRDIKEFMRGGEALDQLISDVLQHGDRASLLEVVETLQRQQPEPGLVED